MDDITAYSFSELLAQLKSSSQSRAKSILDKLAQSYFYANEIVSDEQFDILQSIYEEKWGPYLQIGASIPKIAELKKVNLPCHMGSLDKIKDDKTLSLWKTKYRDNNFIVSDKLNGNSVLLHYSSTGKTRMYKRGDECMGTDVSHLLSFIKHPQFNMDLICRGEMVIRKDLFASKYAKEFKHALAMVTGLTNSKTLDVNKLADIDIVIYQIYSKVPTSQSEQLKKLSEYGFSIVHNTFLTYDKLNADFLSELVKERKEKCPYDIDGIVICANLCLPYPTSGNPKHMIAFKIMGETALAKVISVKWNISKHGLLKPTVYIEPVYLNGCQISKTTGFNGNFIISNGIGPGAEIIITKGGDIIPDILEVVRSSKPQLPEIPYKWNESHIELMLIEGTNNIQHDVKRFVAFFKECKVKYLSETTLTKLYMAGLDTLEKLFMATPDDISGIEGFQMKSADRIVDNIQSAIKSVPLHVVMAGSCIFPNLGCKRLKSIVDECGTELLLDANNPQSMGKIKQIISQIKGLKKLGSFFTDNLPEFINFLEEHPQIEISCNTNSSDTLSIEEEDSSSNSSQHKLFGMTICFSGFRDSALEHMIENVGGRVTSAVSGKTNIVIVTSGETTSTKVNKAKELKIPIIEKEKFLIDYFN